ncbi:hypothetical protein ACIP5N_34065 [Streptomyces sp. NPDC088768]|uniref:hypothetical protein n=1 Tax=Streptomyces sp. NPDC088768 TaxID=3365894 RepID=UPI0037F8585F
MARSIAMSANAKVYRAVVTITDRDGTTSQRCEGPYDSPGAARARVTFWTNYHADYDDEGLPTGTSRATGHVEEGTVTWRPL